jgi:glyoxylase-like metal-dependent hydrolase (beta-lactamase superfamily II)
MELLEGIHRIEAEVSGRPLFLFLGERNVLLDADCATSVEEDILPALDSLGLGPCDLDLLVITHPDLDHQGGANALAHANPGLEIACGALDRALVSDPGLLMTRRYGAYRADHGIGYDEETSAWLRAMSGAPRPVDRVFAGGETIELARDRVLDVLHVPGHSAGHIALRDSLSGALFSGDCVQGAVYLGLDGTPKLCPTYTDVGPYLLTIEHVGRLEPSELHGCHWPAARGGQVAEFLEESRAYVERLDGLVRRCLEGAAEALTLATLIARVNAELEPPWATSVAAELVYSIAGHLEALAARWEIASERGHAGLLVYRTLERL